MNPTDPTTDAINALIKERDDARARLAFTEASLKGAIAAAAEVYAERDAAIKERDEAYASARSEARTSSRVIAAITEERDHALSDLRTATRDRDGFRASLLQFRGAIAKLLELPDGEMTPHDTIVGSIVALIEAARDRNEVAIERNAAMQAISELHDTIVLERLKLRDMREAWKRRDDAEAKLTAVREALGAVLK